MKKPILSAKYCSSEFLSARLTRHVQAGNVIDDDDDNDDDDDDDDGDDDFVQAGNRGHIFENVLLVSELLCHNSSDKMMTMIMVTSYFPKAASMFWYNASETPVGQFEYAPK